MLIILDRDGVINQDSEAYIKSPEEWVPIPGSLEKIAYLSSMGHTIAVATNQSGVARGLLDLATLAAIHKKFLMELKKKGGNIACIYFCPHHPKDACKCRKPQPGLLFKIAKHCHADIKKAWFIGDSWVDIQAAITAGCQPVLVKTGKGRQTLQLLNKMHVQKEEENYSLSKMRIELENKQYTLLVFDSLEQVNVQPVLTTP